MTRSISLLLLGLLALSAALLLPLVSDSRFLTLFLTQLAVMVTFAMSYNVLLGQTGLLSFGHAVYFGGGVFAALYLITAIGGGALALPLEFVPLGGALAGLAMAAVLGLVSVRRAGTTFAMISLGMAELITAAAMVFPSVFGGEQGVSTDRMVDVTLTGLGYGRPSEIYLLVLVWALVSVALMVFLSRSPLGRMANAVRDNPQRVEFLGYDPYWIRFLQFCIAGTFAGLAGSLFALTFEIANAEVFGLRTSANVLIATYLGGITYVLGPVVGAFVVLLLELNLARITDAWLFYYGLLFLAIILFAPRGLTGILAGLPGALRRHGPASCLRRALVWGPAVLSGLVGGVMLVELSYHLSNSFDPSDPLRLFWRDVDATNWGVWALALGACALSAALVLRARRGGRRPQVVAAPMVEEGS
ncbi:branched-chain amino acid ABC transporter permease [Stappia indica]|uniref:branched-chain amino acid ABC transporter permease n=1 Tax=Stappia indica TaxID=538381 RepID=UPI001CD56C05|nr:branched-chain amino acid ABC transporter permease [Stappia indica]MCA1300180.1 branched-chain amino acid ABC transporter permease [Stappia indica]